MIRANQTISLATRIVFMLIALLSFHHVLMAAAAPETIPHSGLVEECRISDGQIQTFNPSPAPATIPTDIAAGWAGYWALHQPLICHQTSPGSVSLAMLQVFLN